MVFYPIIAQENEKQLPVRLEGIGREARQGPVHREKDGFPYHQILLVTHGAGRLQIGGKEFIVKAGMCFFLEKRCPHSYEMTEEPFTTRWICYDGTGTDALHTFFGLAPFWVGQNQNFYALRFVHNNMLEEAFSKYDVAKYSGKLYQMIVDFALGRVDEIQQERLEPARLWVSESYGEDITLEQMAAQAKMTQFAFCREFRKKYGITPMEFVNQVRLQQAKRLLIEEPDVPVKEIAGRCGFRDAGYFGRVFKRYEKTTPLHFRSIWGKGK